MELETKARLAAATLLQKDGVYYYLQSQLFADLVEMTKAAVRKQEDESQTHVPGPKLRAA